MRKREEMRNMGKVGSADRNTRGAGKGGKGLGGEWWGGLSK